MNGTFISVDGWGAECRYLCGFRKPRTPHALRHAANYRVDVRMTGPWHGQRTLNLNAVDPYVLVFGSILAHRRGWPAMTATPPRCA